MKIPKTITVKGEKWKVTLVKDLHDEDEKVKGLTHFDERLIQIEANLTGRERRQIFWHEVSHAIIWESHLSGNTGGLKTIVEEILCDSFGDYLADNASYKPRKRK
jgi:hypothetical protein